MVSRSLGEFFALAAVFGWVVSALSFESAGRRIGSLPVNVIRLAMAALMLALINAVRGLSPWPPGIGGRDVLWLLASGFVGFFLGDLFLFRSYLIIGSRMAMLIMSLSPPVSALLDRLVFGTRLTGPDAAGMALTMAGVTLAVSGRPRAGDGPPDDDASAAPPRPSRWIGYLLAFGGAAGQSGGMILGKLGMMGHDALGATFVRSLGGLAGFLPLVLLAGAAPRVARGLRDGRAMARMSAGALAGPVLGVSAILMAMRFTPAGVVSAITAIVPVVIILPSVLLFGDRVRIREVIGAVLAVAGVVVLILT